VGLGVVADRRGLGQRREGIERGKRAGGVLDAGRMGGDLSSQRFEDLDFALQDALVRADSFSAGVIYRSPPTIVCLRW
jgi:hypothetical protein